MDDTTLLLPPGQHARSKVGKTRLETVFEHCFETKEVQEVREALLRWFDQGHRSLPWRENPYKGDGYAVWVSEIMLQQTRIAVVKEYYTRWMTKWPTLHDFAAASLDDVYHTWQGLGFYRRARLLHEGARKVVEEWGGVLPRTPRALQRIPGIGRYTAGAIASIAFGQVAPLVDGNVSRVLARLRAIAADVRSRQAISLHWQLASDLVDPHRPGDFNEALMELGETICLPQAPTCHMCPLRSHCFAWKEQTGVSLRSPGLASSDESPCAVCEPSSDRGGVMRYPPKGTRAEPRDECVVVCVVVRERDHSFLVARRPSTGLLANLWEFPMAPLREDLLPTRHTIEDAFLRDEFSLDLPPLTTTRRDLGKVVHRFSHICLHMHVELMSLSGDDVDGAVSCATTRYTDVRWVSKADLSSLAMSTCAKKVMRRVEDAQPSGDATQASIRTFFTRAT